VVTALSQVVFMAFQARSRSLEREKNCGRREVTEATVANSADSQRLSRSRMLSIWCGTSNGSMVIGMPDCNKMSAASGSTYTLNSAAGVIFPHSKDAPAIITMLPVGALPAVIVPLITGTGYLLTMRVLERMQPGSAEDPRDHELQASSPNE
jgi:hypothetical protein